MYFDSLQGWLNWQEGFHGRKIDLGLERVGRVYSALLNKDVIKPPTITVAGTNGKGSSIAFLEAIYLKQGYRVGSYTSPHILNYNERIKIDGKPVSDAAICAAFTRIEAAREDTSLSYFEFGTLAALDIFQRSYVDIQLLEVGLGGRLDAVNIIDPDVSLITSICIDHTDWLGETREAIGREKAGIFRTGVTAVVGDPDPPDSLIQCAETNHTPVYCLGKDFSYNKQTDAWNWLAQDCTLTRLPFPQLKGEHQLRNASAVLLAVSKMNAIVPVAEDSIRHGISAANIDGRYQLVNGKIPVLLDVGHNTQAASVLVDFLLEEFPERRIHAIFSMMSDKDIQGVIKIMKPVVYDWYVTPLKNPRVAKESIMQEMFRKCSVTKVNFGFADFSEAYSAANSKAKEGDMILIFGSFFLVSEYLAD